MPPTELHLGFGIYAAPTFIVIVLALLCASATAVLLNRYRLSRYFLRRQIAFFAMVTIFVVLIGTFIIPV
ncbi:MAG: hypothetical protein AAFP17_09370 [Pseudomonadota bacterium]